MLRFGSIPESFNVSALVLIPKADNREVSAPRSPGELRTISLGNTDHKIIAAAIAIVAGEFAANVVSPSRFGGLRGRSIEECITRAECAALNAARATVTAGWLVLDLKAVFPSLKRSFM